MLVTKTFNLKFKKKNTIYLKSPFLSRGGRGRIQETGHRACLFLALQDNVDLISMHQEVP